jgi:MoxR-like ATPase
MIGRAAESRAIERFVDASARRQVVIVLEGEPGIGKTTLWAAGIETARKHLVRVLPAPRERRCGRARDQGLD